MKQHLMIALPHYWAQTSFNHNLSMLTEIEPIQRAGWTVSIQPLIGDTVHRQRNQLCAAALDRQADAVLFVDVDTGFRGRDVVEMLASGLPVVGANYPKRQYWFNNPIAADNGDDLRDQLLRGTIATLADPRKVNGMIEVLFVGTGLLSVRCDVLREMIALGLARKLAAPCSRREWVKHLHRWFFFDVTGPEHPLGAGHEIGEDWNFCDLVRQAGHAVWCHPTAVCSHAGWHNFEGSPTWPPPLISRATRDPQPTIPTAVAGQTQR